MLKDDKTEEFNQILRGDGIFTFCLYFFSSSLIRKGFSFSEQIQIAMMIVVLIPLFFFFISQLNLQDENLLAEIHQTQQRVGFGNPMVA